MTDKKLKHLIFLDFDGVMTSIKNGTSFLCEKIENYHPEKEIMKRFEILKDNFPDLKIVLLSAWTKRGDLDDATQTWEWKKIPFPTPMPEMKRWLIEKEMFLGAVDPTRKDENGRHVTKYKKVCDWIKQHEDELDNDARMMVIDDDDTDFNGLRGIENLLLKKGSIAYLKTDVKDGFTYSDMMEVLNFFT